MYKILAEIYTALVLYCPVDDSCFYTKVQCMFDKQELTQECFVTDRDDNKIYFEYDPTR